MHRRTIFAIGLAIAAISAPALAQQKPGPLVLTAHQLKGGVYWVEGGVSNSGFIVGDKGVVVFDAQRSSEGAKLAMAEIAKVTSKPVDTVVLSHADPDHVGGLPAYPAGSAIIEHENTQSEIEVSAADPSGGPLMTAMYQALLKFPPTKTIASTETMVLDGVRMVLMHVAPAHTSGDIFVYLPDQKIVFAGDIITTNTGRYPVIHYATGGSSLGWIDCMKAMLALDADTYVPGHGAIETKAMLQTRLRDVEELREQIKTMVKANKTLAEVKLALPEPVIEGALPFPSFEQTTYDELTKGYPPAEPPWHNFLPK